MVVQHPPQANLNCLPPENPEGALACGGDFRRAR